MMSKSMTDFHSTNEYDECFRIIDGVEYILCNVVLLRCTFIGNFLKIKVINNVVFKDCIFPDDMVIQVDFQSSRSYRHFNFPFDRIDLAVLTNSESFDNREELKEVMERFKNATLVFSNKCGGEFSHRYISDTCFMQAVAYLKNCQVTIVENHGGCCVWEKKRYI